MCTIPDVEAALTEVRRVLRPGGCHLTRQIVDLVEQSGFTIKELDVFYEEGSPKVLGADSLGVAAV